MDELLRAVSDLRIKGSPEEEAEFEEFKRWILRRLRVEEIKILKSLKGHHLNTLKHNIMVARDTHYIATKLGLEEGIVVSLTVAAILHDIGKLDIHYAILDLNEDDLLSAYKFAYRGSIPTGDLKTLVLLEDVIKYKASKSNDPRYFEDFRDWLESKGLGRFLLKPVCEYYPYHQTATRRILEELGVSAVVIDLAASHHMSYFDPDERKKKPKECRIIEIADKFNALIQSEGVRAYFDKMCRTEALDLIVQQLREEFGGHFHGFEENALRVLAEKYLPGEIKRIIIPNVKLIIDQLRREAKRKASATKPKLVQKARRLLAIIVATLTLSKEFGQIIDISIVRTLEVYEFELKRILSIK